MVEGHQNMKNCLGVRKVENHTLTHCLLIGTGRQQGLESCPSGEILKEVDVKEEVGSKETVPLIWCLLCKHKDPGSIPRNTQVSWNPQSNRSLELAGQCA